MKTKLIYILLTISLLLNIANFAYTYDLEKRTSTVFYSIYDYFKTTDNNVLTKNEF